MMIAVLAFLIDTVIGDPNSRLHPVALIGKLISFLEHLLYPEKAGSTKKLAAGGVLVILVLLVTGIVIYGIVYLSAFIRFPWGTELLQAFLLSFTISPKSLAQAGREIFTLLVHQKLGKAREKVGWIVGRDTDKLDAPEVVRATVETIAENTSDGIIAPLFFFAIGGVPLAMLYRAVNTMDSMIAYKNDRYLYFGRIAARLDDVLNFIPARITGMLFIVSAMILRFDARHALVIMKRDASGHPSPNGGYCEASLAGALHIRLGGYNSYFGKKTFRAYMGDAIEQLAAKHIMGAIRMMYTATVFFLLIIYAIAVVMGYRGFL